MAGPASGHVWRRGVALGVAVLLTVTALIAVAVLLGGGSGPVQGRVLATTAMLAGFGVLALPASMLLDLGRARPLASAGIAVDALAAALAVTSVWWLGAPERVGRASGVAAIAAIACAQVAALTARRRPADPAVVGWLFWASTGLAAVLTALMGGMIWLDAGTDLLGRVTGALVVLDLLTAALQPVLARARPSAVAVTIRVRMAEGPAAEVSAEGRDLAAAVADGIRRAEAGGESAVAVDILERHAVA